CRSLADERQRAQQARAAERRDEDLQRAKQSHAKAVTSGESLRDERLRGINEIYTQKILDVQTRQQTELREADAEHERKVAEARARYESGTRKLESKYRDLKERIRARHEASWRGLADRWRAGMDQVRAVLDEVGREVDGYGPPWDDPSWGDRPFPRVVPPVVRFGAVRVDLDRLPNGLPADARLREGLP